MPLPGEQPIGLLCIDQPAEQVRYLAALRPRLVVLESAGVCLEQQRRRPARRDLLMDRQLAR